MRIPQQRIRKAKCMPLMQEHVPSRLIMTGSEFRWKSKKVNILDFTVTNEDKDILNDLVQVVFIRAYYSLNQLRDDSKFGEWVCAIAKNEALKFLKTKQKGRLIPFSTFTNEELEVEWNITPENWLEEKEIKEIISQLPAGYGKVFQMAVIEGYSHKEIAEKLGIEPHSSSSQLARAKAMLRKMINKRMLAAISIIFISIPLYRIILRMYKTEDENTHTAQIKSEDKGQPKVAKKQTEEKPVQTNETKNPAASKNYTNIAQTTSGSLPEVDTLQIPAEAPPPAPPVRRSPRW